MNTIPFAHAHTPSLVVVSVIIAILASYTALDLAGRVTAAKGAAQFNWLLGGATAMGLGIWSMHFTAMLAFQLPIPVAYDIPIVVLSLFVAIGASAIALYTSSRPTVSPLRLILSGLIMGGAIAAMHYIGMAAMRLEATLAYAPTSFILSILIAVTASLVALWLSIELRNDTASVWNWFKLASAGVMGVAISGMHYTGMHAAIFTPAEGLVVDMSRAIDISVLGAGSIAAGTFVILGFALLLSVLDQRLVYQTARLFEREEVHSHELETLNQNLERYVANLQLVAEVSRITSGILDQTQLVSEVVHQVQSTFNYYHAHLYLYDEDKKTLQVVGGTGEAGRAMLLSGHHIPVGKGLVGRAAATNEIVSVLDVTADPDWLPNILLPDTKAEIAVPIALGNEVL
ncbi:MAG: MHYT domain-containing protein, partial [Chloroflexota bacterium]